MDSVNGKTKLKMRILHYILGYPPHRTGGLTKYALDLIAAEKELGHEVFVLYPGNFSLRKSAVSKLVSDKEHVDSFVLTNALPVPLMYGTRRAEDFMEERRIDGGADFLRSVRPDVLHVHTLMGLPIELLKLVKDAGIRIVYTTHDYFGLCPRVNFINNRGEVCDGASVERCEECCRNSHGRLFLKVRNSKYVVPLKKVLK